MLRLTKTTFRVRAETRYFPHILTSTTTLKCSEEFDDVVLLAFENDHLEHRYFSYIYYTYTHVTWPKKHIYFLKTKQIYNRIKPKHRLSLAALTAPTCSTKATVKSMHMARRRSVLPKLSAAAQLLQLCIPVLIVRACVRRACIIACNYIYVSVLIVFFLCAIYIICHILR